MSTLLDLSSQVVASLYPFQLIEERHKIIPEPVQRKIIFHAFPPDENYVLLYSNHFEDKFKYENYIVEDVVQIGFYLSGSVRGVGGGGDPFPVRLNFDRHKITSIACNCSNKKLKQIFWCDHVVALAIYRIRNAESVEIRVPISETLLKLSRSQLQKLIQYLLSEHTGVLPTAQKLADSLETTKSKINSIHGAPDPTAGGSINDDNVWALNETNLTELLKDCIYDDAKLETLVTGLFSKISLLLSKKDTNAPKILQIITQSFLLKPPHRNELWDQLTNLWEVVVMNPTKSSQQQDVYYEILQTFTTHPNIPLNEHNEPILNNSLQLIRNLHKKDLRFKILKIQALNIHGYAKQSCAQTLKLFKKLKKLENFELDLDQINIIYKVLLEHNANDANEFAILSLGQNKQINNLYLQEKYFKNEEKFLSSLKIGESLIQKYAEIFLKKHYHNNLPLYNLVKFMYKTLPNPTTFKLCIKMLKQPNNQQSMEHQQINLTLLLINNSKTSKASLETILKTLTNNCKSTTTLFKLAQESFRLEESNNNLINFSFNLGLYVLKQTLKFNHRRRWDIVRWVMNSSLTCGFYQIIYLLNNWAEYFTPNEAVGTVASQFLSRGTSLRLNLSFMQQGKLGESARGVALVALGMDPANCALNGLTICESDGVAFEAAYGIILEAAKKLSSQQIFTIARYMEHRGYPLRGYKLAAIAISQLQIPINQETHSSISDIHWTCTLAQSLGDTELSNLIPIIITNIKCASVLSEILRRAANEPPRKLARTSNSNKIYTRLKLLVEATITSYITTIHNRLTHISPRHYGDFIEYLCKAKECFLYKPDGGEQFRGLIEGIKSGYKGKKKLIVLMEGRFC